MGLYVCPVMSTRCLSLPPEDCGNGGTWGFGAEVFCGIYLASELWDHVMCKCCLWWGVPSIPDSLSSRTLWWHVAGGLTVSDAQHVRGLPVLGGVLRAETCGVGRERWGCVSICRLDAPSQAGFRFLTHVYVLQLSFQRRLQDSNLLSL